MEHRQSESGADEMRSLLEQLYDEHAGAVYRYALGCLGNRAEAEDVVQGVWLAMARNGRRLIALENPGAYLWIAVRNRVRSGLRNRGRKRSREADPSCDLEVFPAEANPEMPVSDLLDLQRALEQLPRRQKEAVVLVAFAGLNFREAGERLGIPLPTVVSRYRRAVRMMQEMLKEESDEGWTRAPIV